MVDEQGSWASRFPDGRVLFYEGGEPERFVAQVKEEFGFDPSAAPSQPYDYEYGWDE